MRLPFSVFSLPSAPRLDAMHDRILSHFLPIWLCVTSLALYPNVCSEQSSIAPLPLLSLLLCVPCQWHLWSCCLLFLFFHFSLCAASTPICSSLLPLLFNYVCSSSPAWFRSLLLLCMLACWLHLFRSHFSCSFSVRSPSRNAAYILHSFDAIRSSPLPIESLSVFSYRLPRL